MVTGVAGKGGALVVPPVEMVYSPGGDIVTALLLLEGDNSVRGMIGPQKTVMKAHVQDQCVRIDTVTVSTTRTIASRDLTRRFYRKAARSHVALVMVYLRLLMVVGESGVIGQNVVRHVEEDRHSVPETVITRHLVVVVETAMRQTDETDMTSSICPVTRNPVTKVETAEIGTLRLVLITLILENVRMILDG